MLRSRSCSEDPDRRLPREVAAQPPRAENFAVPSGFWCFGVRAGIETSSAQGLVNAFVEEHRDLPDRPHYHCTHLTLYLRANNTCRAKLAVP